jgi:hypothetical protein
MAKKVWISLPLITSADTTDAAAVGFTKGGTKKDLEVEVAAFITKWLMDKDVPFGIDFESCGVDRALVIEALPKRLQKILGATVPVVAEPGEVAPGAEAGAEEQTAEVEVEVADTGADEEVAEATETGEGLPDDGRGTDGPSELG